VRHLLGNPGSAFLYGAYALGLAAALMTAIYMTRDDGCTPFHGPNRTGEPERKHLHEAPWIMTGPLVVHALLTCVLGGWLNLPKLFRWVRRRPSSLARAGRGKATLLVTNGASWSRAFDRMVPDRTAVAIAIAGIAIAWTQLKPDVSCRSRGAPSSGFARGARAQVLRRRGYDAAIVEPTVGVSRNLLWRGIDAG
jgi:NADH-quinone oxidoreductase subunit L